MTGAFRPSFSIDLPVSAHEVIAQLAAQLETGPQQLRRTRPPGGGGDVGLRDRDQLVLTVPATQAHFWSPWLTVDVAPRGHGTHLFAKFSPHPSVWTGFMFGYLTLAMVLVFSLVFVGALAMTGGEPWALWISAGASLGLAGMWWVSQLGQRLAHAQMEALRDALERALAACDFPAVHG